MSGNIVDRFGSRRIIGVEVCMTPHVPNTLPTMDPEEIEDEELEEIRSVYPNTQDVVLKPHISVATRISPL